MAWLTTNDGRKVNTDWFNEDEKKKYRQFEENEKEAIKKTRLEKLNSITAKIRSVVSNDTVENYSEDYANLRKLTSFVEDMTNNWQYFDTGDKQSQFHYSANPYLRSVAYNTGLFNFTETLDLKIVDVIDQDRVVDLFEKEYGKIFTPKGRIKRSYKERRF